MQVGVAEGRKGRHRRALVDAARAFEMCDLELDALVLRTFRRQIRRTQLRTAGAEVGVAVEAAGGREELRPRDGLRRQLLLLHPAWNSSLQLGAKGFLRRCSLVGEDAHREGD